MGGGSGNGNGDWRLEIGIEGVAFGMGRGGEWMGWDGGE